MTPKIGLRQVLVTQQDKPFVVGPLSAHGEQLTNPVDTQMVEALAVHLLERRRITQVNHLSGRGELTEIGDDRIPQLPSGVSESYADRGTARGFNQVGGLVAGRREIYRANPLVENSARYDSIKKHSTRLLMP